MLPGADHLKTYCPVSVWDVENLIQFAGSLGVRHTFPETLDDAEKPVRAAIIAAVLVCHVDHPQDR